MSKECACGCGQQITPKATFAKGHYQRGVGGFNDLPPNEKTCERCGETYHRNDLEHRQSNKHWRARRYCTRECQEAALADLARGQRGDAHPGWKGPAITRGSGRARALRIYRDIPPCEVCGAVKSERHHKDGNTANNEPANVAFLCRKHHIQAEDRMAYRRVENMTPEQQQARLERRRTKARERARRYRQRQKDTA